MRSSDCSKSVLGSPNIGGRVFAIWAARASAEDPISALASGEFALPKPPAGWERVRVAYTSLNHHDVWSLRGVGLRAESLPMVLGCDATGYDEKGNRVIVYPVISSPEWVGDETLDPKRSLLSEVHHGTFADEVWVPKANIVPLPDSISMEAGACLPTSWLTAYRMLTECSGVRSGDTVLIQGASGGVSTALTILGKAMGLRVWVTSRDEAKRAGALALGADEAFESGARLPGRVDAVMETVGQATWAHSVRALRPGGTIVVSGATSGDAPSAELTRVFFLQLKVVGATMGSLSTFRGLLEFVAAHGISPPIHRVYPKHEAEAGFREMVAGTQFGKVVYRFEI